MMTFIKAYRGCNVLVFSCNIGFFCHRIGMEIIHRSKSWWKWHERCESSLRHRRRCKHCRQARIECARRKRTLKYLHKSCEERTKETILVSLMHVACNILLYGVAPAPDNDYVVHLTILVGDMRVSFLLRTIARNMCRLKSTVRSSRITQLFIDSWVSGFFYWLCHAEGQQQLIMYDTDTCRIGM